MELFLIFGLITIHKFVQFKLNTLNYVHDNIFLLMLQYEYSTTVILQKT
jgi:hypothetical protein